MDEEFGSPFGEDLSAWVLPNGFRPHEPTIGLIRGISGSGMLTQQEVYLLAEYLNGSRDARHAWPGNLIFKHLLKMFNSEAVTDADYGYLGRVMDELDQQCTEVAEPLPAEAVLPGAAMKVEELHLPQINRELQIAAEGARLGFDVDLSRHVCSCPGWYGNRRHFKAARLQLCCAHIAAGFVETFAEGEEGDCPRILKDLMAERSRRGRGIDPKSQWKLIKIRMRPHLISYHHEAPSSIYAFDRDTQLQRFVYHHTTRQWSFGQAPQHHGALAGFIDDMAEKTAATN
jgi:hypothetical protein